MQAEKLRIGLLVDDIRLAAWACRMIQLIRDGDYAEIVLVVRNGGTKHAGRAMVRDPIGRKIMDGVERWLVGKPGFLPPAFEPLDATSLLARVEVVEVHPRQDAGCDYIEGGELAALRARNIDVFIKLGFGTLRGGILSGARYGVWSCEHSDSGSGCAASYRAVMESWPETESVLKILADDQHGERTIYRSLASTNDRSLADNASNAQWKALHFIPRKLKELREDGAGAFFARLEASPASLAFNDRTTRGVPSDRERAGLVWRKLFQKIRRKWDDSFYFRQWFLLYDIGPDVSTSLARFRRITPPKDRFWADPFIVARDDHYYIFLEELVYSRRKGHISVLVMNKDGGYTQPKRVLEAPYHLSYPFVFEHEGDWYLIPESFENRTIELYKCTSFPYEWQFHMNLMEACGAVDATLLHWQGKWWMFANRIETDGASTWDELFLHYSDTLFSPNWTPHKRNPIVSDTTCARPAGRLFVRHGRLYRPSQNCSRHYGYGFNLSEVTKLTESEYEETIVARVEPRWDQSIVATHTFNFEGGLTVIDGQLLRRK